MAHKFDPAKKARLDNPERKKILPPLETLKELGIGHGQRVADVGCGTGYFTLPASELVGFAGVVYAVDISSEMLAEVRNKIENNGNPNFENIVLVPSRENSIPLAPKSVEVVFMANVIHELEDPEAFFKEINRILCPQGKIALVEWKKEDMNMGPPVHERISEEEASRLLAQFGFKVDRTIGIGPAHYGMVANR